MNSSLFSKIAGWGFFGLGVVSQIVQGGLPHGVGGWLSFASQLLGAVGIHHAANSGPTAQDSKAVFGR